MNDPKSVINAVLEDEKKINDTTVYPLTLGRYALLELAESPFLDSSREMSMTNMMPSLYVMTHDMKELKGIGPRDADRLYAAAQEWADGINLEDVPELVKSILQKMQDLMKVAPSTGKSDDDQKKS